MTDAHQHAEPLLKSARHGATQLLTLNDHRRRNPLSAALRDQLIDAIDAAFLDDGCRAIVLSGEGAAFCSGGDISQMKASAEHDPAASQRRTRAIHKLIRQISAGAKPVVVAVEGAAYGAGLSLVAAADYAVAGDGARFSAAFARLGLMADCGLLWSLPRRIGLGWARDMLLTGRVIETAEARALGLVNEVVPRGEALERALQKAESYADVGPLAIAATKAALAKGSASLDAALDVELDVIPMLLMTADHAEARSAFLDKRKPVFRGR